MFTLKPTSYYDDPEYDYRRYWIERDYENKAEAMALRKLLYSSLIKEKNVIADIGAGFGRLTPIYAPLFKKCILIDPSKKLLQEAGKLSQKYKNLSFIKAFAEKLPIENKTVDVIIVIRTLHHLKNLQKIFKEFKRILKPTGFLVLEFANKIHFKNLLKALVDLNFDRFSQKPEDICKQEGTAPFINYHPKYIRSLLLANNFRIIKNLSVSNLRDPILKKIFPTKWLLFLEYRLQTLASRFSFGPSIFILAQKA